MKKFILALSIVFLTVTVASAQRQVRNIQLITKTDAAGADTIKITPKEATTMVNHTLTDSCTYKIVSTSHAVVGDEIIFMVTNTAGGTKFKTIPASGFEVTGADSVMTITASKRATQTFIFDGTKFIEKSKIVQ